ncbi:hypothetical protein [Litchfieldella xinjiangensis]|uniref:hypothetical protein n=1 Tax=Litchfieldella xinjiangensis TaxID=1166948 RepID=UPI0005BB8473|nr:hypothetical protein [Halomonas xinjiangensis]
MRKRNPHRWIMNALRLVLLAQAGFSLLHRHGYLATLCLLVILISFLPHLLERQWRIRMPPLLEYMAIGVVLASLLLGEGLGYYERFWWWDISLHGISGFLLGSMGFVIVHGHERHTPQGNRLTPSFTALFACLLSVSMGALWEIFEFTLDSLFDTRMQHPVGSSSGLPDTMGDLIMNTVGAVLVACLGWRSMECDSRGALVSRSMSKFIQPSKSR